MDQPTQERYRPIIESRLAAIESRLAEIAPQTVSTPPGMTNHPGLEARLGSLPAGLKSVLDERLRTQLALQRIDGGYFGRCIRCGRDVPRARLEADPEVLTCGDCPPRRR